MINISKGVMQSKTTQSNYCKMLLQKVLHPTLLLDNSFAKFVSLDKDCTQKIVFVKQNSFRLTGIQFSWFQYIL